MLTSESKGVEFLRFYQRNVKELQARVDGVINKKYRRTLVQMLQKGEELPFVFGTLKIDDLIFVGCAQQLKPFQQEFSFKMDTFLIMKDLREQTKILVENLDDASPYPTIFNAHAIRRYKERMGLDQDMDFFEVCKHMHTVGKSGNSIVQFDGSKVYGTNENHRMLSLTTPHGVFLGYLSLDTHVNYVQTFVPTDDLRDDQHLMHPDHPMNKRLREAYALYEQGLLSPEEFDIHFSLKKINDDESIEDLNRTKLDEDRKLNKDRVLNFDDQIQKNRSIAENRLKRKGYK